MPKVGWTQNLKGPPMKTPLRMLLLAGTIAASTMAQAQVLPRCLSFDPDDPTNVAEIQEYCARLWLGMDQGDMPSAMEDCARGCQTTARAEARKHQRCD